MKRDALILIAAAAAVAIGGPPIEARQRKRHADPVEPLGFKEPYVMKERPSRDWETRAAPKHKRRKHK